MKDVVLRQQGRAAIDFVVDVAKLGVGLSSRLRTEIAAGVDVDTLPDDLDEIDAVIGKVLAKSDTFRVGSLLSEYAGNAHGQVAHEAFDEIADSLIGDLTALENKGPSTLDAAPDLVVPDYYKDVWFHLTKGGWDGHPYQGYIHGELVHRAFVSKVFPLGDMFAQRRAVLKELPDRSYRDILEFGTSAGYYTVALQEAFPDSHITGVDLAVPMLRQAQCVANSRGWNWTLLRRTAENTGLPAESFDLVTAYSFFHEMPESAIRAAYREALRVLRLGGTILVADVTPYAAQDKVTRWRANRSATRGGEPYWRESASLDWAEVARQEGFADTVGRGLGDHKFPWVVTGRKK